MTDSSLPFGNHVDGISGNLDYKFFLSNECLAAQARRRLNPPGLVKEILFLFFRRLQGLEPATDDHMTGGAGTRFLAGVVNVNVIAKESIADARSRSRFDARAIRTQGLMR